MNPTPQSAGDFFCFIVFLPIFSLSIIILLLPPTHFLCFIVFNALTTLWCIWSRCSHWIKSLWSTLSIDAELWFCVSLHFFIAWNFLLQTLFFSFKYWGKSTDISVYIACAKMNIAFFLLTKRELLETEKIQWTKNSFKCIRWRRRWWLWW